MNNQDEPIVKNAVRCGVCGAPADRYATHSQCQQHAAHFGDLKVGIFSDLSYPDLSYPEKRREVKIPRKYFQNPNVTFEVVDSDGRFLYGGDNVLDGIGIHHDKGEMETYSFRPKNSGCFDFWCDSNEILKVERVEKSGLVENF